MVHDVPSRVVCARDLLLLKLFAIPDRPDPVKAMQDRTDVATLLRDNADSISREDIVYLAHTLLGLAFTREDVEKYQQLITWLNDTLDLLGMADRRYQSGEHGQGHPSP
jgi:hypothetical protein